MNITIVTGPFLPAGVGISGAVEKRWLGVAKIMAGHGHDVTIVSREWPMASRCENVDGVLIRRCGGYGRSRVFVLDVVRDFFYSARALFVAPPADITVTNAFWLPLLSFLRKKRLGCVVVNAARFPKGQMWLYRHVDRISAVSHAVAEAIADQTPQVARLLKVIPNPVDVEVFRPAEIPKLENGGYRFLYTGRVHPEKGLHLLVQALKSLTGEYPGISLSILGVTSIKYGGGGDAYVQRLEELADGLPLQFESNLSDPRELAGRMSRADYYCYPSLADIGESFGIAPLEAMSLGFAPILSNLGCFHEFADTGNSFVFDHLNGDPVDNLASTIREVLASPDLVRSRSEKAVETARKFSYENIAEMYLDDWKELLLAGNCNGQ